MPGADTALTIAGSDSIGGAGIQADLKTFWRLHVHGMSVITALTAQNTAGVSGVFPVPPNFVGRQLDAVLSDVPPGAIKTGMLAAAGIVEVIASKVREYGLARVVADPVMVSSSGTALLDAEGVRAFRTLLLPLVLLVTPNAGEAGALAETEVRSLDDMERAARRIHEMGARNVLVKGGHVEGDAVDVLFDGKNTVRLRAARIPDRDTHGTGCVLSAAITAHLALGRPLNEAVRLGKAFVTEAIRNGFGIGRGQAITSP